MTVIRPNSISGVSSITGSGGDIKIFRADGTAADLIVNNVTTGIVTATTFVGNVTGAVTGSGANLTSIPAAQLTGTVADARLTTVSSSKLSGALPALDGSALTGVGASFGNSSINTSGIITATAFIPTTGQLSHRNIIINGDMRIAQRGTSSTTQSGYSTVDRITPYSSNTGVTATFSQVDVTSGGAYDSGFRKAWQVTKGAGTAAVNSQINMGYKIESQDIANSGWKYTDPNSSITFSCWLKTSVSNHNPQLLFVDNDNSNNSTKYYQVDVPVLTANTWTKITYTIPGHADQVYNNDTGNGIEFQIILWYGTNFTDAGNTMEAWTSFGTKPVNTTWLTTNGSTFQITGLQLEVGPVATPFEHKTFSDNLRDCQRYYYQVGGITNDGGPDEVYGVILPHAMCASSTRVKGALQHPVNMRTAPSISGGGSGTAKIQVGDSSGNSYLVYNSLWGSSNSTRYTWVDLAPNSGSVSNIGESGIVYANNSTYHLKVSAEL